jgi:D-alanyl-D-alanine carboxypeptidase
MRTPAHIHAQLLDLTRRSKTPGLQYVAVNADGILFEHASGWADIRRQVPMTAETTLMAYSMSKTVTAAAVLQLVQTGRVDLDSSVEHYLGSLPYGPRVTVRQLISHTSGIPNPIPLRWVHSADAHASFDEAGALAAVLRDHPRLAFEPGRKYSYSNIGYWLLGRVVEAVSGQVFSAFVGTHILAPLSIVPAELAYSVPDVERHATGYLEKYSLMNLVKGVLIDRSLVGQYAGHWLEIRGHYPNGPAFGGLVGSARGFARFLQDQVRPHSLVLDDATRSLFYAAQRTSRGAVVPMTLGWHVGERDGAHVYFKEGGGGGFHCMMRVYRNCGIGTVVMCNATGFDVRALLDAVDQAFVSPPGTDR